MTTNVLVLGDGTGGLVTANLLAREAARREVARQIGLIGESPLHTYQPGLLFLPFQTPGYSLRHTARDRGFVGAGVEYLVERITAIDQDARTVTSERGSYGYDWLVLALGPARCSMPWKAWRNAGAGAHRLLHARQRVRLAPALQDFKGGDVVIDIAEMPFKCPVAPIEFVFMADWFLKRGIRNKSEIELVTPLPRPSPNPRPRRC